MVASPKLRVERRHIRLEGSTLVFAVAIGLLLLIVGYPLLWLLMAALGIPGDFQLGYIARVYTRWQNLIPLVNTLILAVSTGIISVLLGVPLAWAIARTDIPMRRTVQALVALAYITPPYLTAIAYIILLGPDAGYFNRALQGLFGLTRGPLNIFSMGGVLFVIGMHVFPFTFFMTHSALRSVDASYEEAAQLLGARRWGYSCASTCRWSRRPSPVGRYCRRSTRWPCLDRRRFSGCRRRSSSCRPGSTEL